MNTNQYKKEFISEAADLLEELNQSLLLIEKDSEDIDNINKAFRAFHTLKGNGSTMGYNKFSETAHSLEDVLGKIRDKELNAKGEVMDLIFEGCDLLEEGLERIKDDDPETIENEQLIRDLKKLTAEAVYKEETESLVKNKAELTRKEDDIINKYKKNKKKIHRVVLVFDKENQLKTAKTLLMIRNLSRNSDIIKTIPSMENIKSNKFSTEVELLIASSRNKNEIEEQISSIVGIKHIFVLSLEEEYIKPKETVHEEKEKDKSYIIDKHHSSAIQQVQNVKVDMKKLDALMNLIGELLINNIRMQDIHKKKDYNSLKSVVADIDRLTLDLQDEIMQIRMVPIGNIFNRFPRMVRDLAKKEDKQVEFIIEGNEITFDRTVLDKIGEPIVHMLRNSIDHGIEKTYDRIKTGKPSQGTVKLIARREKNHAVIEVSDDGSGIDTGKVKEKAINKKIISPQEAEKMTEEQVRMLIFKPNLSTNEIVTNVSGRGVGMDVVMNQVRELGGSINLESSLGKGTKVSLRLPLTLAIITSLLVEVNNSTYAIPLSSIDQTIDLHKKMIKTIRGHEVFIRREQEIPLVWLQEMMGGEAFEKPEKSTVVIVNKNNEQIGIAVDKIISQQQILIKGLDEMIKRTKGIGGATILGDGSVALIIDIETLI